MPEQVPENQIIVPVPLDEYLELLSARENVTRPMRTHIQSSEKNLEKVSTDAVTRLINLLPTAPLVRRRTIRSCGTIGEKVFRAACKFGRYHLEEGESPFNVFRDAMNHYQFFYDPNRREKMMLQREKWEQTMQQLNHRSSLSPISVMQEIPNLTEYQHLLHEKVQSSLPIYLATYFIPRPKLVLPPEISQALFQQ